MLGLAVFDPRQNSLRAELFAESTSVEYYAVILIDEGDPVNLAVLALPKDGYDMRVFKRLDKVLKRWARVGRKDAIDLILDDWLQRSAQGSIEPELLLKAL